MKQIVVKKMRASLSREARIYWDHSRLSALNMRLALQLAQCMFEVLLQVLHIFYPYAKSDKRVGQPHF